MIWLFCLMYVLPFVLLTILVEAEWFGWATTSMVVSIAIYSWLHRLEVIPFIKEHGLFCLEAASIYIAAGVAWSFFKWFLLLMRFRSEFRDAKASFVENLSLPKGSDVPSNKIDSFKSSLQYKFVGGYSLSSKPRAADSKSKIVAWTAFWPCSIIGYVFNEPVRRLFNTIFTALRESYQKMADKIINDPELK